MKNQQRGGGGGGGGKGGMPKKGGGLGQLADLRAGLVRKGEWCF